MRKIEEFLEHKLIFLGDYIDDNGKHLGDVLDTFMALEKPTIFLKGNHEEEFLNFYSKYGTNDTKRGKILNHFKLGIDHLDWLRDNLVYSYENDNAFFSHAGIDDRKSLSEQTKYDLLNSAFKENLDHITSKFIIQGHIIMGSVKCFGNHWFVDTGCGLGGHLSALVFPELKIISSNN
ncbi:metallophosphoesterase [Leptospira levettii]|nr:metallophosphoesterase [Leptospira levettii]